MRTVASISKIHDIKLAVLQNTKVLLNCQQIALFAYRSHALQKRAFSDLNGDIDIGGKSTQVDVQQRLVWIG